MIKEDFVSFEVAKLLKEKGFKEECEYFYDWYKESESYHVCSNGSTCNNEKYPDEYSMPTYQMAMKWLREVRKLSIEPFYMFPSTWEIDIKYIDKKTDLSEFEDIRDKSYNSYEEAVEAGIKYCLENLI